MDFKKNRHQVKRYRRYSFKYNLFSWYCSFRIQQQNTLFLLNSNDTMRVHICTTYLLSLSHTKSWSEMKIRVIEEGSSQTNEAYCNLFVCYSILLYPHFLPTLAWNKVLCFKWLFSILCLLKRLFCDWRQCRYIYVQCGPVVDLYQIYLMCYPFSYTWCKYFLHLPNFYPFKGDLITSYPK